MLTPRPRDFSLQEAASLLGISRQALVHEMEQRQVLYHDGPFGLRPTPEAMAAGHFRLESGSTFIFGTLQKHYHRARVTVQGLAWIDRTLTEAVARAS